MSGVSVNGFQAGPNYFHHLMLTMANQVRQCRPYTLLVVSDQYPHGYFAELSMPKEGFSCGTKGADQSKWPAVNRAAPKC
jgi:hypothetical protein